jgi:hypothetical protein
MSFMRSTGSQESPSEKQPSIYARLKSINADLVASDPSSAVWRLETIIRDLRISRRWQNRALVAAIEAKIAELQTSLPEQTRVPVLKAMLHEILHESHSALKCYQSIREKSPYCWHAYLYAANLLQQLHRYGASKAVLNAMNQVLGSNRLSRENLPKQKHMIQLEALLKSAQTGLEKQHQARMEKKLKEAETRALSRQQKKGKKQQASSESRHLSLSEMKRDPGFNIYSVLSDDVEPGSPVTAVKTSASHRVATGQRHAGKYGAFFASKPKQGTVTAVKHEASSHHSVNRKSV